MERQVGEIFEYNGEWYQCVEQPKQYDCATVCELCAFSAVGNCELDKCSGTYRSDSKSVIFKKLEKVGVPFVYEDKVLQRLRSIDGYSCVHCLFKEQACNFDSCDKDSFLIETKLKLENMEEKKLTYEELEHYYDSTCGLWAIDRDPKQVTLEWIVENAFQLGDTIPEKVCASNLKPFDLEAAKAGKLVCTRDGRKARIISFDRKFLFKGVSYPIIALVEDTAKEETIYGYNEKGKVLIEDDATYKDDLMMLPQKKEGWINLCKNNHGDTSVVGVFPNREEAVSNCPPSYLGTIKIEWEE